MRIRTLILVGLAVLATGSASSAQSLWQQGRAHHVALIADNRARDVGDIITIVVDESQNVKNDEKVKLDKSSDAKAEFTSLPAANQLPGKTLQDYFTKYFPDEWHSTRTFDAKNAYEKKGDFTTQLTATVIDVQPNGNLVVEGRRKVTIDGEEKWMTITGLVRSFDVDRENSVPSALVANASVRYESCGPLQRNVEKGWFETVIDFLWPF